MKHIIFFVLISLFSLLSYGQEFPYSKIIKFNQSELIHNKFKYNADKNLWILRKNNGLRVTTNVLAALSGSATDVKPHVDDYIVILQMGLKDSVSSLSVRFYNKSIYHSVLYFAKENGSELLESESANGTTLTFK